MDMPVVRADYGQALDRESHIMIVANYKKDEMYKKTKTHRQCPTTDFSSPSLYLDTSYL
jgi:hypothetical protein